MDLISVDIVIPIYKGKKYIESLITSLRMQKKIVINKIIFAITDSEDSETQYAVDYANKNNIIFFIEEKKNFSHSLTRQKAIIDYCSSNIVVMISQDVKIFENDVIYNLVKPINDEECVYSYARQICSNRTIEKYIREKNYPSDSYVVSSSDVEKMQIMAFFASDACSAYNREVFILLGGYGGYDVMMGEDMLYSKIILDAGYKKKYCANAIVEHSHKYSLKQLYDRYYETGVFHSKVKVFNEYKSTDSGIKLALYVLSRALKKVDIPVIFRWLPDMTARYLGMKKGKKRGTK